MKWWLLCAGMLALVSAPPDERVEGWRGRISDSMCGAKHEPMEGVQMTDRECTLATVRGGSKFVFVLDENDAVYQIANQEHKDLVTFAGDPVTLTGVRRDRTLTVETLVKRDSPNR